MDIGIRALDKRIFFFGGGERKKKWGEKNVVALVTLITNISFRQSKKSYKMNLSTEVSSA